MGRQALDMKLNHEQPRQIECLLRTGAGRTPFFQKLFDGTRLEDVIGRR